VQVCQGPLLSLHWKVELGMSDENRNTAVWLVVPSSGRRSMVVVGSIAPSGSAIVHAYSTGGSSMSANLFVDCTANVWDSKVRLL
jgi:hypothetical protein